MAEWVFKIKWRDGRKEEKVAKNEKEYDRFQILYGIDPNIKDLKIEKK